MHFQREIERDARDLLSLAQRMANAGGGHDETGLQDLTDSRSHDWAQAERALDRAALALRHAWLATAHHPGDMTLKSPCAGETTSVPGSGVVDFGYERDLDVSLLEHRGDAYLQPAAGWSGDLVLCRGGQSALSCVLHFAVATWGRSAPLVVAHAGAYFETTSLLDCWSPLAMRRCAARPDEAVDLLIAEPVYCDGQLAALDTGSLPRARRAVVLDTTLVGPDYDLSSWLRPDSASATPVIALSSGLKLDQAGLELANVGIVRIFARHDAPLAASAIAAALRRIRGLTGSGLTLDEMSALSAPWFMDRAYAGRYTRALFDNNAALAAAIGTDSAVFASRCHPSLSDPAAVAPFCALQLRHHPGISAYRRLADIVEQQATERRLVIDKGGSFGFRGHRFELIEPEQGQPFLRVALGWRGGHSCDGLCELFAELAAHPSFAALDRALPR